MEYFPTNWVKIKVTTVDGEVLNKILCGWSGGYLDGDSWQLSSEPQSMEETEDKYVFTTRSGNKYHCSKHAQHLGMNCAHLIPQLEGHKKVESVEVIEVP